MTTIAAPVSYTYDSFFAAVKPVLLLAALVGDFSYSNALRIGGMIWRQFPEEFQEFAANVMEPTVGPRAAIWCIRDIAHSELPGGWDLWKAADAALTPAAA